MRNVDEEVFTTLLSVCDCDSIKVFRLGEHIQRLLNNANDSGLSIPSDAESVSQAIRECLSNSLEEYHQHTRSSARVRLIVRSDSSIDLHISPYKPTWEDSPIRLLSYRGQRCKPEIKSTHFELCLEARKHVQNLGADEALLVDSNGIVTEGAWSNIFWFDSSQQLWTSSSNVLKGITRNAIASIHDFKERDISLANLLNEAAEIFITQSTSGISLVQSLDIKVFASHSLSAALKQRFYEFIREHSEVIGTAHE